MLLATSTNRCRATTRIARFGSTPPIATALSRSRPERVTISA
jgi:hypothetical protein